MKLQFSTAAAFLLVVGASAAHAQTFIPLLTATVGSGSEESFLTVDFQDGTQNDNFAFGYKYDGTKTGVDLLNAFASNGLLTDYIFNGRALNGLTFDSHSEAGFLANAYWAYYKSPDGQNWAYSNKGVTGTITNGGWDGWSWDMDNAGLPPTTPAAVPEASSVFSLALLLALGAGAMAFSRKKIRV
jgi:hypothetical protein